jgi:hypothetical protein
MRTRKRNPKLLSSHFRRAMKDYLNAIAVMVRSVVGPIVPDLCGVIGLALVAIGFGLYSLPLGFIVAGLAFCLVAYLSARGEVT